MNYRSIHNQLMAARPPQISEGEWIATIIIGLSSEHNERGAPMKAYLRSIGYRNEYLLQGMWDVAEIINHHDRIHGLTDDDDDLPDE